MVTFATPTGTSNIGILGIGAYRPQRLVTNDEICANIDVDSEWIYTRTGIKTRRFCGRDENITTMSVAAGRAALANSGLTGADVDALILATSTHGRCIPSAAPPVATAVGANGVPAMDLSVGCAGFGYAMSVAQDMIRAGSATRVLIIGAEEISMSLDMTDQGNAFIFGDGAGAVVVGPTPTRQMGPVVWGSEGSQSELIQQSMDWKDYLLGASHTDRPYMRMNGTAVFRWAAFEMGKVARRTLEVTGLTAEDIDVFVPHQANARINELLARNLKLREGVPVADDIEYTGNTAAASIPLAMYELLKSGRAKPGDTALLLGYGAGLSYSGQIVAMPPAPVV
ncbi:beta-ketoacyl-ACP synthase III [Gordonia pseudamarae]|jgi:beta-ketoacyl ACP synthase|uniref:Beta-ketoacyl-ACP synthase III n=1 Tax=Gordonia pseudamarae TaxID=2831662 RepID=A0ABX6IHQ0_9ACTN|nr:MULTISPECIES: beta-ketoacyl-ACP synthase III [Gordonia]MBD0022516.1 ketoacyl-ACP synthase III [Gordonia sp. (in: high G+C Gram-positive bacteria)]QHN26300.1 beta-ketoacyl-ACP synthase III [Gordonia pseudamarae]QHN35192.1 beta-ketoacyl-ACP synthase III [Gordonia pseudamarae]